MIVGAVGCSDKSSSPEEGSTTPPSATPTVPDRAVPTRAQAEKLAASLGDTDPLVRASAVSPALPPEATADPLVPAGETLRIDAATAEPVGDDLATVTAEIEGSNPTTWTLLLVREDGEWRVLDSESGR